MRGWPGAGGGGESWPAHGDVLQPRPPAADGTGSTGDADAEPAGIGAQGGLPTRTAPTGHRAGGKVESEPRAW